MCSAAIGVLAILGRPGSFKLQAVNSILVFRVEFFYVFSGNTMQKKGTLWNLVPFALLPAALCVRFMKADLASTVFVGAP